MADTNQWRKGPFTAYLGDDLLRDLNDAASHTGVSMSHVIRAALREYLRQRVRSMTKTSPSGERLIARYRRAKE
jgi:metal-responsive CopG/Arc/MetJ family transcriptional regulator